MTTISEDRVDRAATALLSRRSGAWDDRDLARAALIADAPAILAARLKGMREMRDIASEAFGWVDFYYKIEARIASLEAEMKEGGK